MTELRQAMVDKEGLQRFCKMATRNLDALDEAQWRILLETMKLRILVEGSNVTVKIAVPAVNKDEKSVIVIGTSRSSCWLWRWLPLGSAESLPP